MSRSRLKLTHLSAIKYFRHTIARCETKCVRRDTYKQSPCCVVIVATGGRAYYGESCFPGNFGLAGMTRSLADSAAGVGVSRFGSYDGCSLPIGIEPPRVALLCVSSRFILTGTSLASVPDIGVVGVSEGWSFWTVRVRCRTYTVSVFVLRSVLRFRSLRFVRVEYRECIRSTSMTWRGEERGRAGKARKK